MLFRLNARPQLAGSPARYIFLGQRFEAVKFLVYIWTFLNGCWAVTDGFWRELMVIGRTW